MDSFFNTSPRRTVDARILVDNKGVIIRVVYNGKISSDIKYINSKGDMNMLTIVWKDHFIDQLEKGTLLHAHIDDQTNEVLVLTKTPFPY